MKQNSLRFNLRKILEITKPTEYNLGKFLYQEMKPILNELESGKLKPEITQSLKNYFIIRLVTLIEDFFKKQISSIIDGHDISIKAIVEKDEVSIPLSKLIELKNDKVTKGKIVVANYNFQDPQIIEEIVSRLFNIKFFSTIRKYAKEHKFSGANTDDKYYGDIIRKEDNLIKNWKIFMSIFNLRNSLVHSTHNNVNKNVKELSDLYENTLTFLVLANGIIKLELIWKIGKKGILKDIRKGNTSFSFAGKTQKYSDWFPKLNQGN